MGREVLDRWREGAKGEEGKEREWVVSRGKGGLGREGEVKKQEEKGEVSKEGVRGIWGMRVGQEEEGSAGL